MATIANTAAAPTFAFYILFINKSLTFFHYINQLKIQNRDLNWFLIRNVFYEKYAL